TRGIARDSPIVSTHSRPGARTERCGKATHPIPARCGRGRSARRMRGTDRTGAFRAAARSHNAAARQRPAAHSRPDRVFLGPSPPDASYPSRLAVELRGRFPGRDITVFNRGVNGEETTNMMARFGADVIAAHPQLVLWQIGTNSVLRDHPLSPHGAQLHQGIE